MGRRVPSDPTIKENWLFVPFNITNAATRIDRDVVIKQAAEWCEENAHGRWAHDYKMLTDPNGKFPRWYYGFFFKGPNDAVLFKLTFMGYT